MTLIDRARHLLTCDELRGQLPDEVAEFLRELSKMKLVAYTDPENLSDRSHPSCWELYEPGEQAKHDRPLYTLETPYDAG